MKEIKLQFDFLHGPLWQDTFNVNSNTFTTGVSVIDNDITVQILNAKAEELFSSLYEFDNPEPCAFNMNKYYLVRPQLLWLLKTLIYRLNEINEGSYYITDNATDFLLNYEANAS